jgi:hypothetical protein
VERLTDALHSLVYTEGERISFFFREVGGASVIKSEDQTFADSPRSIHLTMEKERHALFIVCILRADAKALAQYITADAGTEAKPDKRMKEGGGKGGRYR